MQDFPFNSTLYKVEFNTAALKNWFLEVRRDLPWRKEPTPYAVWVSEIMLQQTQVSVVVDYFLRWMARFPTIAVLAVASQEEVIKMWEGLGYYSRARNLHAAAQDLVAGHHGQLPETAAALSRIQGIGPYTVGAILSFAFRKKAAAVDGNVIRVLTRYFGMQDDVQKSSTVKKIWGIASEILPEEEPWLIVEGLIELGATVCKREAQCQDCPIRSGCTAFRQEMQSVLPINSKKRESTSLARTVFVIEHEGHFLLKKAEEGKVMAGLYEFPYSEGKKGKIPCGWKVKKIKSLPLVDHSFTRYRVRLHPTLWRAEDKFSADAHEWISWKEIGQLPFSSGHRKIMKHLELGHAHITH
jgi:A/G-specific adenine glycosylase